MAIQTQSIPSFEYLEKTLTNASGNVPLHERFRALFTLKNIGDNASVDIIAKGFSDDSALLKHELAYVLGQTKNKHALPVLFRVLEDTSENAMVRHEAAEALGAIGDTTSLSILAKYLYDDQEVVRQTCELAINRISFEESQQELPVSIYQSVDPAPAIFDIDSIQELREILLNSNLPLFERYRAMFALRNKGGEESVLALAEGFNDKSALFRHEIAYVFGQMQHPASVPSLIKMLKNPLEQSMVRHEAAEALGSIATPEVLPVLEQYRKDSERVVSESCIVALDMYEYENSSQFQPLDGVAS